MPLCRPCSRASPNSFRLRQRLGSPRAGHGRCASTSCARQPFSCSAERRRERRYHAKGESRAPAMSPVDSLVGLGDVGSSRGEPPRQDADDRGAIRAKLASERHRWPTALLTEMNRWPCASNAATTPSTARHSTEMTREMRKTRAGTGQSDESSRVSSIAVERRPQSRTAAQGSTRRGMSENRTGDARAHVRSALATRPGSNLLHRGDSSQATVLGSVIRGRTSRQVTRQVSSV